MRAVDFRADHSAIRAAAQGQFRRLRFVVEGSELEMFQVKITFGDGTTFSPATRLSFAHGARSRVIALPGAARAIRRIDFSYRRVAAGARGAATVRVFGHP
jgi:hypothetical protein